jgi:hypothetical protein
VPTIQALVKAWIVVDHRLDDLAILIDRRYRTKGIGIDLLTGDESDVLEHKILARDVMLRLLQSLISLAIGHDTYLLFCHGRLL